MIGLNIKISLSNYKGSGGNRNGTHSRTNS